MTLVKKSLAHYLNVKNKIALTRLPNSNAITNSYVTMLFNSFPVPGHDLWSRQKCEYLCNFNAYFFYIVCQFGSQMASSKLLRQSLLDRFRLKSIKIEINQLISAVFKVPKHWRNPIRKFWFGIYSNQKTVSSQIHTHKNYTSQGDH